MGTIPDRIGRKRIKGRVKHWRCAGNHSRVVTLGSVVIYVADAGIFVVEVFIFIYYYIYIYIYMYIPHFFARVPIRLESTIGISQLPSREPKL